MSPSPSSSSSSMTIPPGFSPDWAKRLQARQVYLQHQIFRAVCLTWQTRVLLSVLTAVDLASTVMGASVFPRDGDWRLLLLTLNILFVLFRVPMLVLGLYWAIGNAEIEKIRKKTRVQRYALMAGDAVVGLLSFCLGGASAQDFLTVIFCFNLFAFFYRNVETRMVLKDWKVLINQQVRKMYADARRNVETN